MHSRIQLDTTAQISVREGKDGATEIVILDGSGGDASMVIELMGTQAKDLRKALRDI